MNQPRQHVYNCESISPERAVDALRRLGSLQTGATESFERTYFDSFDWRLFDAGKALAVSRGAAGWEIGLIEGESALPALTAAGRLKSGFASEIQPGELRRAVEAIIDVRRMLPRLSVSSTVLPVALLDREGKTILRARIEQAVCRRPEGGSAVPLGLSVILLPVRGYKKPLRKAQDALTALAGDAAEAAASLWIRGLRAVGRQPGDYSSKLSVRFDATMCAGAASRRLHLSLLDTMERNGDGAVRNLDSEFLHDFRVAIRRTRSALRQVDKDVLPADIVAARRADFRWLGRQTNRMRDLDVYLIAFPGYRAGLPGEYRPALDPFHDHLVKQSRSEGRRIAALIKGARYREIRDRWRRYLIETAPRPEDGENAMLPVRDLASARISKLHRRMVKAGWAIDDSSPAEALHNLRIVGKELRYLLEFFSSLYPEHVLTELVRALKKLQTVLGDFQDSKIQSLAIRDFARELAEAEPVPVETQMAMGMVADTILRRRAAARGAFHHRLARFASPEVSANFRFLFEA